MQKIIREYGRTDVYTNGIDGTVDWSWIALISGNCSYSCTSNSYQILHQTLIWQNFYSVLINHYIFRAIFFCHKDYFIFQFKVFLNTFHNIKFSSQSFDVSEMLNNISNLCLYISIGMKNQTGLFFVFLGEVYGLSANNLLRYKLNIFSHLESVDQLSFNRFNSLYSSSCVHT